jgi:hypothetical protein
MMDINGDNQTKVTSNGGFISSFLPNGKIIFTNSGNVKVINPDGSNQITLDANGYGAFFSPDGTKIAFNSDRDGNNEIYVMNADGSSQTRLTNDIFDDSFPSWSGYLSSK